jgi:hypothetical protein
MTTVLLFKTTGPNHLAARLHSDTCQMLRTAKRGSSVKRIDSPTKEDIDDLNERGFPVGVCKCLRSQTVIAKL